MKEEKNKKVVNSKSKKTIPKKVEKSTKVKNIKETKKTSVKKIDKKEVPTKKVVRKKEIETVKKCDWKQYIYYIALVLLFLILLIGIWDIATYYKFNNSNTSYLMSSRIINKNHSLVLRHAKDNFSKMNGDYFVYVSYTGSGNIYSMERRLRRIIKEYDISDKFYYVNVDSLKNEDNKYEKINYYLNLKDSKITKIPTIYYVNKNNEVLYNNIITRNDDNNMEIGDFQKLLDVNGFTKK